MKKFLYFSSGAPNATTSTEQVACFPIDKLSHFEMRNATDLRIHFTSQVEMDNDSGIDLPVVALDITSGKHKEVIEAITGAIASASAINVPMITVADVENSTFLSSHITSCGITVVDAA
jgi:hypothetical protein